MKMRIALPVKCNRLHDHFGGAAQFALLEVDPKTSRILHKTVLDAPEHVPGAFPRWLHELGVKAVIVGGIGRRALALLNRHGIDVRTGTPHGVVEELVKAYLRGALEQTSEECIHPEHDAPHGRHEHHHRHGAGRGASPDGARKQVRTSHRQRTRTTS